MLTTSFPCYYGDYSGKIVYELAVQLVKRGVGVCVVAPHAPGIPKQEQLNGISVCRFQYMLPARLQRLAHGEGIPAKLAKNPFLIFQAPLFLFSFFLAAFRLRRRCDIIHAHWTVSGLVAVLASKCGLGKPIVLTVHGSDLHLIRPGLSRLVTQYVFKHVDRITAVDQTLKDKMVSLGVSEDKIAVISNGVDVEMFKPMDMLEARRAVGLPPDVPVVLFIGSLIPQKGVHDLLDAMPQIRERIDNVHFVFIGEGELDRVIAERTHIWGIAHQVQIKGARPFTEIPLWINAADVLVLPSWAEGKPGVVLEAMACGTPVVATPVGGISELLENGRLGKLVAVRDASGLAAGIVQALTDQPWQIQVSQQTRESLFSHGWTWDRTAKQMADVYQELGA